jgi:hypothetical protein
MDLMYTVQLLGNVRDFLGAIAVVATLGYLAVQIRQSNLASQATAIQSFFDAFSTVNVGPSRDVRFVQLIRRGFNEWEDLSKDEQAQMHLYWNDYISKVHMGYRLYERGILDEGSYTGWENFLLAALQTPGVLGVWSAGKAVYPSDFVASIARRLVDEATRPASITDSFSYWRAD